VARLYAERNGRRDRAQYRTGPLRFRHKGAPDETSAPADGALEIEVEKGDELSVVIVNPTLMRTLPETAVAAVEDEPNDLGATWKDALKRTAACYGGDSDDEIDFDSMTREEADEYSRFILTENMLVVFSPVLWAFLDDREIDISKGDQAAAILIRDEFVEMMDAEIPRMREEMVEEENAWKLFLEARTSTLPFWNLTEVAGPQGEIWTLMDLAQVVSPGLAWTDLTEGWEEVTLHDPNEENLRDLVLRMVDRPDQWGLTPQQAHLTAYEITRTAYFRMLSLAESAVERAKAAGDCDVAELMLIAGQDADHVVARILPRLVRRVKKDGRETWEPDLVAQNFVKSLRIKGEALRALEDYGRIDDTYKALAVAAATAGTGFALSATGAVATGAAVVLAGDVFDTLVFGGADVQRAIESEALLRYAEGAALVLGEKFYAEAEAARTEWYETAISVLLPGAASMSGFRQLRSLSRANRGARVMLELKNLSPATLARLPDSELRDLAAYFTNLHQRRPGTRWQNLKNRGESLGQRELADLARFDDYFEKAHLSPAPGSVPVGRLHPESHGRTTQVGPEHQVANVQGDASVGRSQLPDTETVALPGSAYRDLPPGEVRINGDGPTLNLGEFLGEGATATAIGVGNRPEGAYRILRRGFSETERGLDDGGYGLLRGVEKGSRGLFEVPKIEGAWLVESVSDPRYESLVGSYITLVKRSEGGAAQDLVRAAGGITPGQLFARDQVVRYLNRNGIAWTDAHFGNFEFKAIDEDHDLWRLVIFDTGGFFPAKGASELEQYQNARAIQEAFALMDEPWRRDWLEALAAGETSQIDDLRALRASDTFGRTAWRVDFELLFGEIEAGYSGCPTMLLHRPFCRRMADLPADLADALARNHTGLAPPLAAPRADGAPARTFTPEQIEEEYRRLFEPPGSTSPPVDPKGSTIDVPPADDGGNVFLFPDARRRSCLDERQRVA